MNAREVMEATSDGGDFILFSGLLKRTAARLSKICNDLRLLSSGTCTGISKISLPARRLHLACQRDPLSLLYVGQVLLTTWVMSMP